MKKRWRALSMKPDKGIGKAFVYQAVIISCTMITGVVLARGFAPDFRGQIAVANLATSLGSIVGAFGIPERYLIRGISLVNRTSWQKKLSLACVGAASTATILWLLGDPVTASTASVLSLMTIIGVANLYGLTLIQLKGGVTKVLALRALHEICSITLIGLCLIWLSSVKPIEVYCAWTITELLTFGVLCIKARRWQPIARAESLDLREIFGSSTHLLAQLGTIFVDRGLIAISATIGGQAAAGALTVAQSAISPASAPVQALSSQLLDGCITDSRELRRTMAAAVTASLALGVALAVALCFGAQTIFGRDYSYLSMYAVELSASAVFCALWRLMHFRLRATGRASLSIVSDVSAILSALLIAHWTGLEQTSQVCLLLLGFSLVGLTTACLGALIRPGQMKNDDENSRLTVGDLIEQS